MFKEYVEHFYKKKKYAKSPAEKLIAKMHLNQLYGYFGRKQDLIETINIHNKDLIKYVSTRIIKNIIEINSEISTILVVNNINQDIVDKLNSCLEINLSNKFSNQVKSNVAIAAAVTSYARIHMIKYKLNNSIYYTDTDSVFVDKPLDSSEVGKDLGLMKDELEGDIIKEGYFLGIKRYGFYYKDKSGNKIEKSVFAGIKRNSLTFNEIKSIFNGSILIKEIPSRFYKSFNNLNITIKSAKVSIRMNNEKELINNIYIPKNINNLYHDLDNRSLFNKLKNRIIKLLKKYIN